jgi:hypothetical protein
LANSLAIAAAQRGRRVHYGTLIDLITSLEEAQAADHLARRLDIRRCWSSTRSATCRSTKPVPCCSSSS